MIVGEDDSGAAMLRGVDDDLAQRKVGAGLVTLVMRHVEAMRALVEMRDPQAFAGGIGLGEAAGEKRLGGGEAVELQRMFGTLIPHATGL